MFGSEVKEEDKYKSRVVSIIYPSTMACDSDMTVDDIQQSGPWPVTRKCLTIATTLVSTRLHQQGQAGQARQTETEARQLVVGDPPVSPMIMYLNR